MPFNGGGFGNFGFGQAQPTGAALGATAQAVGVKPYGNVWASYQCPSCDSAIREMQAQIIRLASAFRISVNTTADGQVGAGTVAALQAVAQALGRQGSPQAPALVALAATAQTVAQSADQIRDLLAQAANTLAVTTPPSSAPASAPPPNFTTSTSPTITITPGPGNGFLPPPAAPVTPWWQPRLPYIIGGVILAVGTIAAIAIVKLPPARH